MSNTLYSSDVEVEYAPPVPMEFLSEDSDDEFSLDPPGYKKPPAQTPPAAAASSARPSSSAPCAPRHSVYQGPPQAHAPRTALSTMPLWLNQPTVMPSWQGTHDVHACAAPGLPGLNMGGTSSAAARTAAPAQTSARTTILPLQGATLAESEKAARKPRMVWKTSCNEHLVRQVLATGVLDAPHGQVRDAWQGVADVVSSLPDFELFGGGKAEACRKRCHELMAQFRKDTINGEFKSGARTGDSEELHRALSDLIASEDGKTEEKEATVAAKLGRETGQARRVALVLEKSMKTTGSSSRKKRKNDDGTASTQFGNKDSPAAGSASAPIPITSDIGGYLRSKTDSEETKKMKLQVDMVRAKTEAQVAENKAMESKAMLEVAKTFSELVAKQMAKTTEG